MASFVQVGTATFDLMGFLAFTASAVLEALRCVLVQVLMGDLRYNAAEVRPPGPPISVWFLPTGGSELGQIADESDGDARAGGLKCLPSAARSGMGFTFF